MTVGPARRRATAGFHTGCPPAATARGPRRRILGMVGLCPTPPGAIRTNCRAASAGGSASLGRWPSSRSCWSATSRFGARRLDPVAGRQPLQRAAGAPRGRLPLHRSRSERRPPRQPPHRRHVPRAIVEIGTADSSTGQDPRHPYTKALLAAVPIADPEIEARRQQIIAGEIPSALRPPPGCRFHTRCPMVMDQCKSIDPPMRDMGQGRAVACHLYDAA